MFDQYVCLHSWNYMYMKSTSCELLFEKCGDSDLSVCSINICSFNRYVFNKYDITFICLQIVWWWIVISWCFYSSWCLWSALSEAKVTPARLIPATNGHLCKLLNNRSVTYFTLNWLDRLLERHIYPQEQEFQFCYHYFFKHSKSHLYLHGMCGRTLTLLYLHGMCGIYGMTLLYLHGIYGMTLLYLHGIRIY